MSILLDTHIWIWWQNGESQLPERLRAQLDRSAKERRPPFLSAISLWEAQMLQQKGRLALEIKFAQWLTTAADPETVCILPMDVSVILAVDRLPDTFQGDPADRIIVATALAHTIPLATRDKRIRAAHLVETV